MCMDTNQQAVSSLFTCLLFEVYINQNIQLIYKEVNIRIIFR